MHSYVMLIQNSNCASFFFSMRLLALALAASSASVHGLGVHSGASIALRTPQLNCKPALTMSTAPAEGELLSILSGDGSVDERRVGELCVELAESGGAMREELDAMSAVLEGEWRLLHTSSSKWDPRNPLGRRADQTAPGLEGLISSITGGDNVLVSSASPIQRAITKAFSVSQVVALASADDPRVTQWVELPGGARIELSARGSIEPSQPERLLFLFDRGELKLQNGLRIPYPAPFKLLGDEAKGWLDTMYLSQSMRISRGNKGTTFVFVKGGSKR